MPSPDAASPPPSASPAASPAPRPSFFRQWLAPEWRRLVARTRDGEYLFMLTLAILIGVLCGGAAILFGEAIRLVQRLGWGAAPPDLALFALLPRWHILLLPALGGLLVGLVTTFVVHEAKGHGVPDVIRAVAREGGRIRGRVAVAKTVTSALTIGTGGSCGREGPIIQIGAAIGSRVGQILRMSPQSLRTLVACGASAGIAATFNAPIAGALFSVEVILGEFALAQFSPVIISSVLATLLSRAWNGPAAAFAPPPCRLASPWELLPYALLGIACGLVSILYIRVGDWTERFFDGQFRFFPFRAPAWLRPAIGGLLVGAVALALPHVMGDGHALTADAFHARFPVGLLAALLLAKLLATSCTLGSGGSGGVFSPAICIGALLGALAGTLAGPALGPRFGGIAAWSLAGMGGLVAGSMLAPITAIIIVFEITGNYAIVLPVMLVCTLSTVLVMLHTRNLSIYTLKLARSGIRLFHGTDPDLLKGVLVRDRLRTRCETASPSEPAAAVVQRLLAADALQFYLVAPSGSFEGVVTLADARRLLLSSPAMREILLAEDVARHDVPLLYPAEDLASVLEKFAASGLDELPVVEGMTHPRLVGVLSRSDLLSAYRAAALRPA
jgi:CIC family chloride channel protein